MIDCFSGWSDPCLTGLVPKSRLMGRAAGIAARRGTWEVYRGAYLVILDTSTLKPLLEKGLVKERCSIFLA